MLPNTRAHPDGVASGLGPTSAVLAEARVGLERVRRAAARLPSGQRRLVAWVAGDLIDAMAGLQGLAAPTTPGEADARERTITAHLADLVELTGCGRPRRSRVGGDFELAFRDAAGAGVDTAPGAPDDDRAVIAGVHRAAVGAPASPSRDERMAAGLGIALGVTFTICFATGMLSHLIQDPPGWFTWPTRPVWGYRFTQGLHVATGIATVPLLLGKLWVVLPKFYRWPPATSVDDAIARLGDGVLVGAGLFLMVSGIGNIYVWRPWAFSFTSGHFWAAVAAYGALLVHVGHHGRPARRALRRSGRVAPTDAAPPRESVLTRRGFVATIVGASGLLTVTTVGQTLPLLRATNVLGPRRVTLGPQGLPVNTSADAAGVTDQVDTDAVLNGYRLLVTGAIEADVELSLDDLRAMPQHEAELPIACVEGWSASARWRGVRVRDLLDRVGAPEGASARVTSIQTGSIYRTSDLHPAQARDHLTLLALEVNGEPLHVDHGRPVRLIGANRPGVQQTKWVAVLEVLA